MVEIVKKTNKTSTTVRNGFIKIVSKYGLPQIVADKNPFNAYDLK